jgi:tetratricopeptide (TPR) repeat protein
LSNHRPDLSEDRLQEAETAFRRARAAGEEAERRFPDSVKSLVRLAAQNRGLADFLVRTNRPRHALPFLEEAHGLLERVFDGTAREPPEIAELHATRSGLHSVLKSIGRTDDAERMARMALATARQFVADAPDIPRYHLQLAQCHEMLGDWESAVSVYSKAVAKWPGRSDFWQGRAGAYVALSKPKEALADLTKAVNPDDWRSWFTRGLVYSQLQDWDKAVADQTKAIELNASTWYVWYQRGVAYAGLKEWAKAVADHTKAIELSPRPYVWNWQQRGLCYAQLKQWDAALSDFMKVVELQPQQALDLAHQLHAAKQFEEAEKLLRRRIDVLDKAVVAPSSDAGDLQNLGHCCRLLAQLLDKSELQHDREAYLKRAIDTFAKLAKEQPATASHRDLLARSHYELGIHQWQYGQTGAAEGNLRQATELWRKLAADVPAEPVYLVHAVNAFLYPLAPLLEQAGRASEAEQFVARALPEWTKLARNDREDHRNALADATGLWARLLFDLGKRQQAEQLAAKAVEQWPENAHALIARGQDAPGARAARPSARGFRESHPARSEGRQGALVVPGPILCPRRPEARRPRPSGFD